MNLLERWPRAPRPATGPGSAVRRAWRAVAVSAAAALAWGCAAERPNVLIVTWDTTRADRLGPYGYPNANTPTLDRLAAEGIVFEQARSPAPLTMVSHSTIFTGTYPTVHGVRDNGLFVLADENLTLAEILAAEGYRTGAGVGSFVLDRRWGIGQGFEVYDDRLQEDGRTFEHGFFDERPARTTVRRWLQWLRGGAALPDTELAPKSARQGAPFFGWLHFWEPHHPHVPPHPWREQLAHDLYQAEIATADAALGELIAALEEDGLLERTILVLTADHGEGLGEHGESTHSFLCHDATLHVPLIVRLPDGEHGGTRVSQPVGTVDVLPTVLELLGIDAPDRIQGRSLRAAWSGDGDGLPARPYYAEALSPRTSHGFGELRMWLEDGLKYVHGPRSELYRIDDDPRELRDLLAADPSAGDAARERLSRFLRSAAPVSSGADASGLDEETRQRLAALGYVASRGDVAVRDELREDGAPPQDRVELINQWSRLRQLVSSGHYPSAVVLARRLLSEYPDDSFFATQLVLALAGSGDVDAALTELEGLEPSARTGPSLFALAPLLARSGEIEVAIDVVERTLEVAPSGSGYLLLARLHLASEAEDAPSESERALRAALELEPRDVSVMLELAALLARSGQSSDAEPLFTRALELAPLASRTHYNYGVFLAEAGRLEAASERLRHAVSLRPQSCAYHRALLEVDARSFSLVDLTSDLARMEAECEDPAALEEARRFVLEEEFLELDVDGDPTAGGGG